MKNKKGVKRKVSKNLKIDQENKISLNKVLGIVLIAIIVSFIVSWIVVSLSNPFIKDLSYDSGKIIVQVKPDFASKQGKIIVEVNGNDDNLSVKKEVSG